MTADTVENSTRVQLRILRVRTSPIFNSPYCCNTAKVWNWSGLWQDIAIIRRFLKQAQCFLHSLRLEYHSLPSVSKGCTASQTPKAVLPSVCGNRSLETRIWILESPFFLCQYQVESTNALPSQKGTLRSSDGRQSACLRANDTSYCAIKEFRSG